MDVHLDLKRLQFELEEEPIEILPLQDFADLRFDGIQLHLVKDQVATIPLWVAEILENEGVIKIQLDNYVSPRSVRQLAFQEEETPALNKIDPLMYRRIRHYIDLLGKESSQASLRRLTSIEGSFNTILRLRFRKLLNIATVKRDSTNMARLTSEESWIYNNLNGIYRHFSDSVGSKSLNFE